MFDWSYALQVMPELLRGLRVTVAATGFGMLLALLLGLVWAILRRSHKRAIYMPATLIVEFVRSTPLLVQLYFFFYVIPNLVPALGGKMSPFVTGVLALGLHYSSYTSEVYRAGIEGVARGQWEAARALNLSRGQTYLHIILPQAIPPIIPALGNYLLSMFKDTPMLSAITVLEMLQRAKILGSESFQYLEPLTMVGVLFLVLSLAASALIRWLEKRLVLRTS